MGLGIVFPGQGAQFVGMLQDIAETYTEIDARLATASEVLGFDLADIVRRGPDTHLNQTEITQPALLCVSVALWDVLRDAGIAPLAMAGHSLGEYSALVAAGALDFADAVSLVHLRGKCMQAAVPAGQGGMAAVLGLDDSAIEACCAEAGGIVSAANYNAPGQVVIAGTARAVQAAIEACKAAGAKRAVALGVSVPSHCALMAPAQAPLSDALSAIDLAMPTVPVLHNVNAEVARSTDQIARNLVAQLAEPVRWTACVAAMQAQGVTRIIECGPGNVLTGLIKRIDRTLPCTPAGTLAALNELLAGGGA